MTFQDKVAQEIEYQKTKWSATDHLNNVYNWGAYIAAYTSRSLIGSPGDSAERDAKFKADMVKVAALAQAAYNSI